MSDQISPYLFLEKAKHIPVIDVRSPSEYALGHIPDSFNLPLFDDHERAIVGTLYIQESREKSVLKGLEIVGPKLKDFVVRAKEIVPDNEILIYCWRGGMRSNSMAWLLKTAGFKTHVLEGGYKSYRRFIREEIAKEKNIIILSGNTGSGKTDILHALSSLGEQIFDLENIAHHKGSVFGSFGQEAQPTNEQFENIIFEKWQTFDINKPIWIEDESHAIGSVQIPEPLFTQMLNASIIKINVPLDIRIKRLVNEYSHFKKEDLSNALIKIQKRLGGDNLKTALESIENNDFGKVADIALHYYDKAYKTQLEKRNQSKITELNVPVDDSYETAIKLKKINNETTVTFK